MKFKRKFSALNNSSRENTQRNDELLSKHGNVLAETKIFNIRIPVNQETLRKLNKATQL